LKKEKNGLSVCAEVTALKILNEIRDRLARQEPVTQDLIDQLPTDVELGLHITARMKDGTEVEKVVVIKNGAVTLTDEATWLLDGDTIPHGNSLH